MAAMDIKMILSLVDRASGPAKGILNRIFRNNRGSAGALNETGLAARGSNAALLALNRQLTIFGAGAGAYFGGRAMIGNAIEFETAMANVRKLVSATPAEFAQLEEAIKRISRETPVAATEMADLVAQAGQFGIPTKDLSRFAELGAKTAIAFEMTGEQTGESLSQIRNALGLTIDQLEEYADAINYVADTNGSSEEQLVDFVLRTGAGAKAVGLDPKDLLAIGSAMTEVGVSSQRAGTSVNAMLAKMSALGGNKAASKILDRVGGKGYSKKLQKEFFETPRKAMVDLLKITKEMARPDRAAFFQDLFGLETQDEANALAGNIDKVVSTVEKLGDATNYAGSVQKTFDIFAGTTEQQWKQFTNNVNMASAAMGAKFLPSINDGLHYLNNFFATAENRVDIIDRLSNSFNGFITGLGYRGGSTAFFADVTAGFAAIRDLMFGIEGDDNFGEGGARIFERWRQFGEAMKNSPISTIFDSVSNANVGDLGSGLLAGAAGMGALSIATRLALSPLRLIFSAVKGLVRVVASLSGALLRLSIAAGAIGLAASGVAALAYAIAKLGPEVAKRTRPVQKGEPAWWLGFDPAETRGQRLERLTRPSHAEERERMDWSGVADDSKRRDDFNSFFNLPRVPDTGSPPAPTIAPGDGDAPEAFNTMLSGMEARASEAGSAIQQSLSVTATPTVDNSPLIETLSIIRTIRAELSGLGVAQATARAAVGSRIGNAIRSNLSDGGE